MTTMTATITTEDVARKAVELASQRPEFVYQAPTAVDEETGETYTTDCRYIDGYDVDGAPIPGCLFGHALLELGIDPEAVGAAEETSINQAMQDLDLPVTDQRLVDRMIAAQMAQDRGEPWGEAIVPVKAALSEKEAGK